MNHFAVLTECDQCGQCFSPAPQAGDVCPDCEAEHAEIVAEQAAERLVDNALACKCGAWGFTARGEVYHAADCVCGNT